MDEWLVRLMTVIYPTVIICGSGLLGFWLKLRHERRLATDQQELKRLSAQVDTLEAEFTTAVSDLQERLDFSERLLARRAQLPGADAHHRESDHLTPV